MTAIGRNRTLDNNMKKDEKENNSKHPLIKVVWVVLAITVLVGAISIVLTAMGIID